MVICYIAIEHGHRNSGFTELKDGDFPVRKTVNVYQRVDSDWANYPHMAESIRFANHDMNSPD